MKKVNITILYNQLLRLGRRIGQENSLKLPHDIYKTYPEKNYPFGPAVFEILGYRLKKIIILSNRIEFIYFLSFFFKIYSDAEIPITAC